MNIKIKIISKKMLFSKFCQFRRLFLDQSSPVHPVSESRGSTMSVADGEGQKSLCLIQV